MKQPVLRDKLALSAQSVRHIDPRWTSVKLAPSEKHTAQKFNSVKLALSAKSVSLSSPSVFNVRNVLPAPRENSISHLLLLRKNENIK